MYDFQYHRPTSLAEAAQRLKDDADSKLLAGGHTLIPTLKQRLAGPSTLIDLAALPELTGIKVDGGNLVIGAMTTHAEVAASDTVNENIPALAALAQRVGDAQVRNRGTLGGSIANNDPAADYPAAVLGLGATVLTNERRIPADDFFTGLFETALSDAEIITAVSFPIPEKAGYVKFPNPASRYPIVGVFVAETSGGVRVAVTGAGQDGVFRVAAMERALAANFAPSAVEGVSLSPDDLNADLHASAEYRAHLIGVMAKRAVATAAG
jgi:carbon-monoxide dehydrogenase medium subunit